MGADGAEGSRDRVAETGSQNIGAAPEKPVQSPPEPDIPQKSAKELDKYFATDYVPTGISQNTEYFAPRSAFVEILWKLAEAVVLQLKTDVEQSGAQFWMTSVVLGIAIDPDSDARRNYMMSRDLPSLDYSVERLRALADRHGETAPAHILKPCFWWNPAAEKIELIAPRPGYVEDMTAKGVYPGGWLTAGNSTWSYYLISRPIARTKQFLTAVGLLPGHRSEYDADPVLAPKVLAFTLRRMGELARQHGFAFVLADPEGDYAQAYSELAGEYKNSVYYSSQERWQDEIGAPASRLPAPQRRVPQDGHYGPGMNRLIAEALSRFLKSLLAQP